jgi:hypothetical protein
MVWRNDMLLQAALVVILMKMMIIIVMMNGKEGKEKLKKTMDIIVQ